MEDEFDVYEIDDVTGSTISEIKAKGLKAASVYFEMAEEELLVLPFSAFAQRIYVTNSQGGRFTDFVGVTANLRVCRRRYQDPQQLREKRAAMISTVCEECKRPWTTFTVTMPGTTFRTEINGCANQECSRSLIVTSSASKITVIPIEQDDIEPYEERLRKLADFYKSDIADCTCDSGVGSSSDCWYYMTADQKDEYALYWAKDQLDKEATWEQRRLI